MVRPLHIQQERYWRGTILRSATVKRFHSSPTNHSPDRFFGGTERRIDRDLPGRDLTFDHHTWQAAEHNLHPAPLVGATPRAVDVRDTNAHPLDRRCKLGRASCPASARRIPAGHRPRPLRTLERAPLPAVGHDAYWPASPTEVSRQATARAARSLSSGRVSVHPWLSLSLLRGETVLLHLAPQRHRADVQGLRCLLAIAVETFQRLADQTLLLLLQIERLAKLRSRSDF